MLKNGKTQRQTICGIHIGLKPHMVWKTKGAKSASTFTCYGTSNVKKILILNHP